MAWALLWFTCLQTGQLLNLHTRVTFHPEQQQQPPVLQHDNFVTACGSCSCTYRLHCCELHEELNP